MKPHGDDWWQAQENDSAYQQHMKEEAEKALAEEQEQAFVKAMKAMVDRELKK